MAATQSLLPSRKMTMELHTDACRRRWNLIYTHQRISCRHQLPLYHRPQTKPTVPSNFHFTPLFLQASLTRTQKECILRVPAIKAQTHSRPSIHPVILKRRIPFTRQELRSLVFPQPSASQKTCSLIK